MVLMVVTWWPRATHSPGKRRNGVNIDDSTVTGLKGTEDPTWMARQWKMWNRRS